MKNRKITFFTSVIITLVIVLGLIYSYHNNRLIKNTTYTIDESKYMYAKFLTKDGDKTYNIYFVIPKGYEYEKLEGPGSDEVYFVTLLSDENSINSVRTSASISVEYFFNNNNIEESVLFPESKTQDLYPYSIRLTDVPDYIIEKKLLSRPYLEFMEKQHLLFIKTDKYVMCFYVALPYRSPYSTNEEIEIYFIDLLKSLKIEEL